MRTKQSHRLWASVGEVGRLGVVVLACAVLLCPAVARGESESEGWQRFEQGGVSLEVAPTPVQRTLSVCFSLKAPERMSEAVSNTTRPDGTVVSVEAFGAGDHWLRDYRPHHNGEDTEQIVEMTGRMQQSVDARAQDYVSFAPRRVLTYVTHRPTRANAYVKAADLRDYAAKLRVRCRASNVDQGSQGLCGERAQVRGASGASSHRGSARRLWIAAVQYPSHNGGARLHG